MLRGRTWTRRPSRLLSAEGYREIRRDYVVNRAAGAGARAVRARPRSTRRRACHWTYPEAGSAFGFSLSVVERPRLALSSYGPVEVEMERMEVTDGLVDARIADFLEAHAAFDEAPPRPVRRGDCIKVDVMTTLDGKTVPRLTGNGMLLELVPGAMPEPFVDGVVGMEVGETKVVDYAVRRPRAIADDDVDRYQATVSVLSQQRKAVPPLTDEWVAAHVEKASSVGASSARAWRQGSRRRWRRATGTRWPAWPTSSWRSGWWVPSPMRSTGRRARGSWTSWRPTWPPRARRSTTTTNRSE